MENKTNAGPYVAPELQLVGEAPDVVQGGMWVGSDPGGEALVTEMEFEAD